MFFSPFSIAITSIGEKRANLSAFRTFVRFVLVWICRFPLPLGVCLRRAAVGDCGTPWTYLLPFLQAKLKFYIFKNNHDNVIMMKRKKKITKKLDMQ